MEVKVHLCSHDVRKCDKMHVFVYVKSKYRARQI